MRRIIHIFLALATVSMLAACGKEGYDNSPREPLELSHTRIVVGRDAQSVTVGATARGAGWTLTGAEDWCVPDRTSGDEGSSRITLSFTANEGEGARTATLVFRSGEVEKTVPVEQRNTIIEPNMHADAPINRAIHGLLSDWYYNGEPRDVAPDYNQNWRKFYKNYLEHLSRNDFDGNYWSQDNVRYLYSYVDSLPANVPATLPPLNYGMEFDLAKFDGKLVGRVLYVERGSPAERAGLKRGDWFNRVNTMTLGEGTTTVGDYRYYYNRVIDSLVHPVEGLPVTLGMMTYNGAQQTLTPDRRTVSVTPDRFSSNPVFHTQTFAVERLPASGGGIARVGYMMYNSFDHTRSTELVAAFSGLFSGGHGGEPLDTFILDLRYNKNGSVEAALELGNLLTGKLDGVAGKTFATYTFDGKAPMATQTATFAAHGSGIAPKTVFVLTSPHTAGPAELLINALRGLDQSVLKLVVIGERTQGMAAGMVKKTHPTDAMIYNAWILAFRCANDAGDKDYRYGLVPNGGEVKEWARGENIKWSTTWGWKGTSGATEDKLVQRAVDIIRGSQDMPSGLVLNASQQTRAGYPREFCFPTNMTMTAAE